MNQKITLQDIINSVAQKHGMDKKDADLFVRGVFDLIEEALATENIVKVKGLGTFKLTEVDSRESVDINTGVRIEIRGHRKVTFQPDAGLKDLINKPFSHFEVTLLNENAQIGDEVETNEFISVDEHEESIETSETEVTTAQVIEEEENKPELLTWEPEPTVLVDEPAIVEVEIPMDEVHEPTEIEAPAVTIDTEKVKDPDLLCELKRTKKESKNRAPLFIVLILLLVASSIYYFSTKNNSDKESVIEVLEVHTELSDSTEAVVDSSFVTPVIEPVAEPIVEEEVTNIKLSTTAKYKIVGTQAEYTIKPKDNLSTISTKFYDSTDFWNYIVAYNKDIITNPDNVPLGKTIKIPELEPIE